MTVLTVPVHTCKAIHPLRKLRCQRHESDQCGQWHVFDYGSGFEFRWRIGKPVHTDGCKCTVPAMMRKVFDGQLAVVR